MKVIKGLECWFQIRILFKLIDLSVQVVQWNQRTLYIYCFLILNDSKCFLLTVHFLKNWFFVKSATDQINQKYFWNQKKFENIFDIHLLYHVYIIPRFNG